MPLSRRRAFRTFAGFFTAAALVALGLQPAVPQARGPAPLVLRAGQEVTFTSPQFVVHALWFKANDETGWAWTGSDEVYAVFSDMDPTHIDYRTPEYNDVDEGDTINFRPGDRCMAPLGHYTREKCTGGMAELNVQFSFWEHDWNIGFTGNDFCAGDIPGTHDALIGCGYHDLIGRGAVMYSAAELIAMLPAVGDSREFTHVMDQDAGRYRFRYRITRVADLQRSIVIHLPPDLGLPPSIMLQATVNGNVTTLTWSGATTSTVDIYRNGIRVMTTPNDGTQILDFNESGTFQYRLCNLGSTTACSPQVQVVVP